ncbi:MAG: hypothetical protein SVU32_08065, partial [Candidatus Nanohaloarchaea archaeon]|nr:hypothetical protein [Candidatus Nanohaloarchaea archaeon]
AFYDNGTWIANDTTNASGIAAVQWTAFKATAGLHEITTKIADNASKYYNATIATETNDVVLNASMEFVRYNASDTTIKWFDTSDDHTTNITAFLEDEYNESLQGANVSFYSNATGNGKFRRVGSCLTNSSGGCTFTWNPSIQKSANATVYANATKDSYAPSRTANVSVDVTGAFLVEIDVPTATGNRSRDLAFIKGSSQLLNATVLDSSGARTQPADFNFTINASGVEEVIADNETKKQWTVWGGNLSYGVHTLEAEAVSALSGSGSRSNATRRIEVYDHASINLTAVSSTEVFRLGDSVSLTAHVNNSRTGSGIAGYTCSLYDETGMLIATATTDTDGICTVTWNTNKSFSVGPHNVSLTISEKRNGAWYLPEPGNATEYTVIDLNETLQTQVLKPDVNDRLFRNERVTLDADVRDKVSNVDADVHWFLANNTNNYTLRDSGEDRIWRVPDGFEVGNYTLWANATKQYYTWNASTVPVSIFGFIGVHPVDRERVVQVNDIVRVRANVTDSNSSLPIDNYNVTVRDVYWNQTGVFTDHLDHNLTNASGVTSIQWNTSGEELGTHNITFTIESNASRFRKAVTRKAVMQVDVLSPMNLTLTGISDTVIYRDDAWRSYIDNSLAVNTSTNADRNTSGASVRFRITGDNDTFIGSCTTDAGEDCTFDWNPAGAIEPDNYTVEAVAVRDSFFNSSTKHFFLDVRANSEPVWRMEKNKITYNFTEETGINLTAGVNETFTDEVIEDHPFRLWYGSKAFDFTASLQTDYWTIGDGTGRLVEEGNDLNITTNSTVSIINTSIQLPQRNRYKIDIGNLNNTAWSLEVSNGTHWTTLTDRSRAGEYVGSFPEQTVTTVRINTSLTTGASGYTIIESLQLRDYVLDNPVEIMASRLLGARTPEQRDSGSFEGTLVKNNMTACENDGACEPDGWYVGSESKSRSGFTDSVEGGRSKDERFGNESLLVNISELQPGDYAVVYREFDPYINISNVSRIAFWSSTGSSNLSATIRLAQGPSFPLVPDYTCKATRSINVTVNWTYLQPQTDFFRRRCDASQLELIEFRFENVGNTVLNTTVRIDQVQELHPLRTNENGSRIVEWEPPRAGEFVLQNNITDLPARSLNASEHRKFLRFEIVNGSGGAQGEKQQRAPGKTQGFAVGPNVTSFNVTPRRIKEIVAFENYHRLQKIRLKNLLEQSLTLNITSVGDNFHLIDPGRSQVTIPAAGAKKVWLYHNTSSSLGTKNVTVAVFSSGQQERLDVNITLDIRHLKTELIAPNTSRPVTNVEAGDRLRLFANATVNQTDEITNITEVNWSVTVDGVSCNSIASAFVSSRDSWSINCTAPSILHNPINTTPAVHAEHWIDTVSDAQPNATIYRDVTAPFITNVTATSVAVNGTANISAEVRDNNETAQVWVVVRNVDTGTVFNRIPMTYSDGRYHAQF